MEKQQLLQQVDLFSACTVDELSRFEAYMHPYHAKKNQWLFLEQEPCKRVFFLIEGTVKVFRTGENGKEQIVNLFTKNAMFPHVGILQEGVYPASAVALENSVLYTMTVEDFRTMMANMPHLQGRLMQIIDSNLRRLQNHLVLKADRDIQNRIYKTLYETAKQIGTKTTRGYLFDTELTHQDIADLVGVTRETVTRTMNQLKKEGLIRYDHHQIEVIK